MRARLLFLWPFVTLGVAGLVALALSAVFWLPFAAILPFTLRSNAVTYAAATAQSLPWKGLLMLIAPDALGNAAAGTYWPASRFNPYFHEIYAYAGLLPLLLTPLALWRCRAARPYGLLALLALLVMLGSNTPVYWLLYHLPGSGLLRVPARAGLVFDFALAVLAGFGLDAVYRWPGRFWRGTLPLLLLGVVPALAALQAAITIAALSGRGDGIPGEARPLALDGAARLVLYCLAALALCLILAGIARRRLSGGIDAGAPALWGVALPVLAVLDLFTANGALLQPTNPAIYYSAAAGILSPRDGEGRVLAPHNAVPIGLCMVTRRCYDVQDAAPLALEAYWRLSHTSIVQREHGAVATGRDTVADVDPFFLRLFGVRTVYSQKPLAATGLRPAGRVNSVLWSTPGGADWNVHLTPASSFVYHDAGALPRLFVVPRAVTAAPGKALDMLRAGAVDPRSTVVLSPTATPASGLLGHIQRVWASWLAGDDDNTFIAQADGGTHGAYLVVDDGWFPGWTAAVDGRGAPVLRADYLLRAVYLPPGRHTVRLVYAPLVYLLGAAITLATVLAMLILAARVLVRHPRHRATATVAGDERALSS